MSEPHRLRCRDSGPNRPGLQGRSALAQAVHGCRSLVLACFTTLLLGGCLFPPSLSSETQDAALNSPPAILSVRSDLEELVPLGLLPVVRGQPSQQLAATLLDTDVDDILYVRIFVDYTPANPTPARSSCKTTASDSPQRSVTCDISALCLDADVGVPRAVTVEVFDRELLDSGTPQYKAMGPGGWTTYQAYTLACTGSS